MVPVSGEVRGLGVALLGSFAYLGITVGLTLWGRWVARRQGSNRLWRFLSFGPLVALALSFFGALITGVLVMSSFGEVAMAAPESKALQLANAISNAMNFAGLGALLSSAIVVGCIGFFLWGTFRPAAQSAS